MPQIPYRHPLADDTLENQRFSPQTLDPGIVFRNQTPALNDVLMSVFALDRR